MTFKKATGFLETVWTAYSRWLSNLKPVWESMGYCKAGTGE